MLAELNIQYVINGKGGQKGASLPTRLLNHQIYDNCYNKKLNTSYNPFAVMEKIYKNLGKRCRKYMEDYIQYTLVKYLHIFRSKDNSVSLLSRYFCPFWTRR